VPGFLCAECAIWCWDSGITGLCSVLEPLSNNEISLKLSLFLYFPKRKGGCPRMGCLNFTPSGNPQQALPEE
jgi:hypothetical protein